MAERGIALLVEDNPKILDLNRRMLEKEGLMVLIAKTIDEARELIKIAVPDVAVLDIMLPDGSGLDFLPELRKISDAPVLFLTARAEREDVLAGLTAGGNDYITKPYDIDEFRARVMGFIRFTESVKTRKSSSLSISSLLNEKELSVALYAAEGLSNKDIATKVYLSESRIKTSLSAIYRKLGISDKKDKRNILAEILNV
ncbi:MAG: response regulator [Oscillospiraceae bacterium]|jgi:DNA-binding response OmpR family regulator|nr:response regulator [Oscillospiraceae bacterium]